MYLGNLSFAQKFLQIITRIEEATETTPRNHSWPDPNLSICTNQSLLNDFYQKKKKKSSSMQFLLTNFLAIFFKDIQFGVPVCKPFKHN